MSETHNAIYLVNSDNSGTEYGNTGGSGGAKVEAEYEVTPAQNNHASGTIIYFNQKFYKVTTAITAGDTITIGTNITNANLGTGTQVFVKNMPEGLISADDISYDNTSSGLSATNVQDAVDELSSKVIAQVTADGVKTYNDILYDLSSSVMALSSSDRARTFLLTDFGAQQPGQINNSYLISYDHTTMDSNNDVIMRFYVIDIRKANCKYKIKTISGTTISFTDMTNTVPSNGAIFTVYYR